MDRYLGSEHLERVAHDMNVLAAFLGMREVPELTQNALEAKYGFRQADVLALFGGSILAGGDFLADAMHAGVARSYVIVGGAGHTTETFREKVRGLCPDLSFADDATEAEIFAQYLKARHGLEPDLLEMRSTNCGNNITYLRDLLKEQGVPQGSVILSQDLTMERRMVAETEKEMLQTLPIGYATYQVEMVVRDGKLDYAERPLGMWDQDRYLSLLMGEIPRLTDDEGGYGPKGLGYLVHVDIPDEVQEGWERLQERYPWSVRKANPRFAN